MSSEVQKGTEAGDQAGHTGHSTKEKHGGHQRLRGFVVSDKMNKTRVIEVRRRITHSAYQKGLIRHHRFKIHDEKNESKTGDLVIVISTRPLSKGKHFKLEKILQRGEA